MVSLTISALGRVSAVGVVVSGTAFDANLLTVTLIGVMVKFETFGTLSRSIQERGNFVAGIPGINSLGESCAKYRDQYRFCRYFVAFINPCKSSYFRNNDFVRALNFRSYFRSGDVGGDLPDKEFLSYVILVYTYRDGYTQHAGKLAKLNGAVVVVGSNDDFVAFSDFQVFN